MRRWIVRAAWVAAALLGVAVAGLGALYLAATRAPGAYQHVLESDPAVLEQRRLELESNLTALVSQARQEAPADRPNRWETAVTQDQVNGLLAHRASEELSRLEKAGASEPRVVIEADGVLVACRVNTPALSGVFSARLRPWVTDDNRLALEVAGAWVGVLPLPTGRIVQALRGASAEAGLPAEWTTLDGHETLVVDFERLASTTEWRRRLTAVACREGELYIAGVTEPVAPTAPPLEGAPPAGRGLPGPPAGPGE